MLKILKPSVTGKAYSVAAAEFQDFYKRITGLKLEIISVPDKNSDLVVIGSDAVNPFCNEMIFKNVIDGFKIKYGTDDYHILSANDGKRRLLFLAGGRGRSTIYAVYDFFERQAGCRYFWDGDIVLAKKYISINNLNITESPRFKYRGLRYFAHRSLHRFQAEHWDFEDWQKEIDWMMKKKLNLLMLRIGMDDLFQKAFPEIVGYPPAEGVLPEATPRSYDDRTLFWSMEYRAELRKKILDYAFDRDLMHPEDFGTVTHWYSRTPKDFLEKIKPDFMPQTTEGYNQETGLVWDIRKEKNLDNYFKLTEAHIREYGSPEIFHTIGLAERKCFESRSENLKLKLFTYRLLNRKLREHYPNAPLLIASWDFPAYWEDDEVRKLVSELDPDNTIILDYTADAKNKTNNFTKWGIVKKFPWIFGIFHAFEANSDIRGDYAHIIRRLKIAANDKFCKGMVFWPETSHSDSFMLEFFTSNSWNPLNCSFDEQIEKFCHDRYGLSNEKMLYLWQEFMPIAQLLSFRWDRAKPFRTTSSFFYRLLQYPMNMEVLEAWEYLYKLFSPVIKKTPIFLAQCSKIEVSKKDEFLYRDIIDVGRTTAERVLFYGFIKLELKMEKWRNSKDSSAKILTLGNNCLEMMDKMGDLVGLHKDYSLYSSLKKLGEKHPVNPVFEDTLKANAENSYCRSCIYELIKNVYMEEIRIYLKWISEKIERGDKSEWGRPEYFKMEQKRVQDEFYLMPLEAMAPPKVQRKEYTITETFLEMSRIAQMIISG